jgi:hypothetical protein
MSRAQTIADWVPRGSSTPSKKGMQEKTCVICSNNFPSVKFSPASFFASGEVFTTMLTFENDTWSVKRKLHGSTSF